MNEITIKTRLELKLRLKEKLWMQKKDNDWK